jgi:hypothetical protein
MSLTIAQVYSVRFGAKIALPKSVQDNIARLRITPVAYKPFRPIVKHSHKPKQDVRRIDENWRMNALREAVSAINLKIQTDYNENYVDIVGILNKMVMANVREFAEDICIKLESEDEKIRLKVTTYIFNKAITENSYANLMAECVVRLTSKIPEEYDDILFQIQAFPTMYNTSESLLFPPKEDPDFMEKLFAYFKQKEKKRGYAKFMTELLIRNFVSEDIILKSIEDVLQDMEDTSRKPACQQTEENLINLTSFLFETIKAIPSRSNPKVRTTIHSYCVQFLKIPATDLPSFTKRCKFKIMDTMDECVKKGN